MIKWMKKHKIKGCPFTRTPLNKYMFKSEQWNYSRIFSIRMHKNFLILTYKNFFLYGFILLHKSYLIDFANLPTLMSYELDTYLSLVLEG